MKTSEYIQKIQDLIDAEGDLEIKVGTCFSCHTPSNPRIEYMHINNKRESKERLDNRSFDHSSTIGEKVIVL